jgi:hypothetical protein
MRSRFGRKVRPAAERTSSLSSLTPILYIGGALEFFVDVPFKSYKCVFFWLEIWHLISQIWDFQGILTLKYKFSVTAKRHFRSEGRFVLAVMPANWLRRLVCRGLQERKG